MIEFTKKHGISTVHVKKAHGNTTVPDQNTIMLHLLQKKYCTCKNTIVLPWYMWYFFSKCMFFCFFLWYDGSLLEVNLYCFVNTMVYKHGNHTEPWYISKYHSLTLTEQNTWYYCGQYPKNITMVHFHKIGVNMVVTVVQLISKELLDDQKKHGITIMHIQKWLYVRVYNTLEMPKKLYEHLK